MEAGVGQYDTISCIVSNVSTKMDKPKITVMDGGAITTSIRTKTTTPITVGVVDTSPTNKRNGRLRASLETEM